MSVLRLGVLPDFREERWPSMDLVAGMLMREIAAGTTGDVRAEPLCPPYRRRVELVPILGQSRFARNADRLLNRMRAYPAFLKHSDLKRFDVFHVCDHAYAHLVHALPAERTGVFCHDLDTFQCLLNPRQEPRPRWFKAMMRNILSGMQKAALVFHTTEMVREQIVAAGLIDPARLVKVPLGVGEAYTAGELENPPREGLMEKLAGRPFVMHVGSAIPRKRMDVLFDVFAALRPAFPELLLVKVGGEFNAQQRAQIQRLGIEPALLHADFLEAPAIATLYRHAAALLQPSEAEGFGLPVIEALACGCPVIASSLPSLLEVGGSAAAYCAVGDIEEWVAAVGRRLRTHDQPSARAARAAQAATYSWRAHAGTIVNAYRRLGVY